ncbi:MAG: hypothetical protein Q7V05_11860 [Methanoregula sp.]|nr:hypothetical protein [Methanoregula sp.]
MIASFADRKLLGVASRLGLFEIFRAGAVERGKARAASKIWIIYSKL